MKTLTCLLLLFIPAISSAQNIDLSPSTTIEELVNPIQKIQKAYKDLRAKKTFSQNEKLNAFLNNDSINSIKNYTWETNSSQWVMSGNTFKIYDQNGKLKSYYSTNVGGQKYFQVDLEFDSNGNIILETKRNPNHLGVLENAEQYERKFNSNNQLTSEIYRYWDQQNSRWINYEKFVYAYDSLKHLTLDEYFNYDFGMWSLVTGTRYFYTYTNGKFKDLIVKLYDPQTYSYKEYKKYEYKYDASARVVVNETSNYNFDDLIWEVYFRNLFYYDTNNPSNNTPVRVDYVAFKKDTATYVGRLDSVEWLDWKNSNVFEENILGDYLYYNFNTASLNFEKSYKYSSAFLDQNGSKFSIRHNWLGNSWILYFHYELLMDEQKNVVSNKIITLQDNVYKEDLSLYSNTYDNVNRLSEIIEQNNFNSNSSVRNAFKYEYFYDVSTGKTINAYATKCFDVYPNPSTRKIIVKLNAALQENQSIRIYNLQGQLVQELNIGAHAQEVEINIEQKGLYILSYNGYQEHIFIRP